MADDFNNMGSSDLVNATKAQALNTGALAQSSDRILVQATNLNTSVSNLATAITSAVNQGAWQTWSPSISAHTGTITALGPITSKYQTAGKTVYVAISVVITTNGTGGGWVQLTLPFTAKTYAAFAGRELSATGKGLAANVWPSGNILYILNYDNSYPGADGANLCVSGIYEAA
jgi:hypothetical protein